MSEPRIPAHQKCKWCRCHSVCVCVCGVCVCVCVCVGVCVRCVCQFQLEMALMYSRTTMAGVQIWEGKEAYEDGRMVELTGPLPGCERRRTFVKVSLPERQYIGKRVQEREQV